MKVFEQGIIQPLDGHHELLRINEVIETLFFYHLPPGGLHTTLPGDLGVVLPKKCRVPLRTDMDMDKVLCLEQSFLHATARPFSPKSLPHQLIEWLLEID
ncbi:MAG: hypothetical protein WC922_06130, partial [Synergistaceae bacterium]